MDEKSDFEPSDLLDRLMNGEISLQEAALGLLHDEALKIYALDRILFNRARSELTKAASDLDFSQENFPILVCLSLSSLSLALKEIRIFFLILLLCRNTCL